MQPTRTTQTLLRIYISKNDQYHHQPLYQAIVETLRSQKIAGATVLRGILGYGAKSHLHSANILRLSQNLPIIIEVVATKENIENVIPKLNQMLPEGLITLEQIETIRPAPNE